MSYYQVTEYAPGCYRLFSREAVHCELIVGDEKALLMDTGWGIGPLREAVEKITDKPLILVNSHGHVDHVNGNAQFPGNVYIHPDDMALVSVHGSPAFREYVLNTVSNGDFLPEGFNKQQYLQPGENVYLPAEEGMTFDLGGKTLEIVSLRGHTRGSIGLFYREAGILLTGDTITPVVLLHFDEAASLDEYIASLERAKALGVKRIVPSHSAELLDETFLERMLTLAKSVNWERAEPYQDPGKPEDKPSETVRVMCADGHRLKDIGMPGFTAIVFSQDKL